jgi:hypothetical protein
MQLGLHEGQRGVLAQCEEMASWIRNDKLAVKLQPSYTDQFIMVQVLMVTVDSVMGMPRHALMG